MADYISREAAIALTDQHCFETFYDAVWMEEALRNLQAADVRPVVRGKWESGAQDFQTGYTHTCSVCGGFINMYVGGAEDDYNFCPNCGADMREVKEDG